MNRICGDGLKQNMRRRLKTEYKDKVENRIIVEGWKQNYKERLKTEY